MFFSGFAMFLYKPMYGYSQEVQQETQQATHQETQQETKPENKNMKTNPLNNFIKEIYRVKPETGSIDYLQCDCANFPEYKPNK